jgi:carboxylate-amine ligase
MLEPVPAPSSFEDHAFGRGQPFSLGVEEELFLVDDRDRSLTPLAEQVLAALDGLPETMAGHEAYAAEIELRSPPSPGVEAAVDALGVARRSALGAGATLMGTGLHPTAPLGEAELVDQDRYARVEAEMRGLIRRAPECALHVHVGMPDPEAAVRALNGLREQLPLLAALAANSPFWFGRDSGLSSARAAHVRAYPGRGIPRAFRNWEDLAGTVDAAVGAGGLPDYTYLWWDVRVHPRLGTVEVRELDAQSRLDDVTAVAGLVHVLGVEAARRPPPRPVPSEALAWSAFLAARDGLDAEILDGGERVPAREAAVRTLARVRGLADELEAGAALEQVERILAGGNGADRQRAAHASDGMDGLLAALVRWTAAPAGRSLE